MELLVKLIILEYSQTAYSVRVHSNQKGFGGLHRLQEHCCVKFNHSFALVVLTSMSQLIHRLVHGICGFCDSSVMWHPAQHDAKIAILGF